mmetsp:Transcript_42107/g.51095  ORF Transcript_42107/g.51095 Transcript_42107/m.51095 type:complete len:124 (+) Transcript_42107:158-529(+)|eukprot:CAMPEP_0197860654 /NCGR_PEP_ID=MMETSP1438-20131217/36161_1 /TAXON_ID=1461541 /ORGANISM="Pterosperma sp., Strain CCMP1384" /LENGTH=123 /DNA_ID=CAMNT_0043477597 /DNA_START=149 /DNA_END=520 /DNA_ORIENTATION=+
MPYRGGPSAAKEDEATLKSFQSRVDPNNKDQANLLQEMKAHTEKLNQLRGQEDPRLSFASPEFKEAQRLFTEQFKNNFNRPIEYAMVKKYPWSMPVLEKLEVPVDPKGNPWPMDNRGKPILKA